MSLPAEPRAGEHVIRAGIPEGLIEAPVELEQRVTPLELFFDLVFVFAIMQVTGYVSARPSLGHDSRRARSSARRATSSCTR